MEACSTVPGQRNASGEKFAAAGELFASACSILGSLKLCCIVPALLVLFAGSSSTVVGRIGIISGITLPLLIGWPAVLWNQYRWWTGRLLCFQKTNRQRIIGGAVVWGTTVLFAGIMTFSYFPMINRVAQGGLIPTQPGPVGTTSAAVSCPLCAKK